MNTVNEKVEAIKGLIDEVLAEIYDCTFQGEEGELIIPKDKVDDVSLFAALSIFHHVLGEL